MTTTAHISHEYNSEVTVTTTSGATETLTGQKARQMLSQFRDGVRVISVNDTDTGITDYYNIDCICKVSDKMTLGDPYVKPECEDLFCN